MEIYYLSSMDSAAFSAVREFRVTGRSSLRTGRPYAKGVISPSIWGESFGIFDEVSEVFVLSRHAGDQLPPEGGFPCFVHICVLSSEAADQESGIPPSALRIVALGELYRTERDAALHVM